MSRAELDPVLTSISAPIDDTLQEKCGVVGVYSPEGFAVPISYYAIEALQHRGQDGSGFAFVEKTPGGSSRFDAIRRVGRIATAFNNGEDLFEIVGPEQAIAHTRYATTEARDETEALHPLPFEANGKKYALAHNGQFDMYNLQLTAFECGIDPVILKLHSISSCLNLRVPFHLLYKAKKAFMEYVTGTGFARW